MQINNKIPLTIGIILITVLLGTGCSLSMLSSDRGQTNNLAATVPIASNDISPSSDLIPAKNDQPPPANMVAFEGSIFVASSKPIVDHWRRAGWQIAKISQTAEINQVPDNCTLYRHLGVEDQWIGSCSGYTLIPRNGASHIAVMHTQLDGTSILVQVAPTPDSSGP